MTNVSDNLIKIQQSDNVSKYVYKNDALTFYLLCLCMLYHANAAEDPPC